MRRVVLATNDRELVRRLSAHVLDGGYDLTVAETPDQLERLEGPGALLVDASWPELVRAARVRAPQGSDPGFIATSLEARLRRASVTQRVLDSAAWEGVEPFVSPRPRDAADAILGLSVEAAEIRTQVRRVARFTDVNVLILGETGTGKELVAKSLHTLAFGAERPFVAVNCAAISDHLVESELFGHAAGAFTGAQGARVGLMEAAGDGTLFLDEIGEMPRELQTSLLRALETRTFRRVGSNRDIPLRARVVAATNRLSHEARRRLRRDLYFRLAGVTITTPTLRERSLDIAFLAVHFLRGFRRRYPEASVEIDDRALTCLAEHPWHGNIRELQAVMEHAGIVVRGRSIGGPDIGEVLRTRIDMAPSTCPPPTSTPEPLSSVRIKIQPLPDLERELITRALGECGGNVSRAARVLDIPRSTLRDKMQKYDIR